MPQHAASREQTRILFYCAAGGAVVQGLARMIEAQIPRSRVELVEDPLLETDRHDVALVLLYGLKGQQSTDTIMLYQQTFPQAALGLVVESIGEEITLYGNLFDDRLVQGVLPLNFELDVWLAAVSVLLSGGEFYPFARRRQSDHQPRASVTGALPSPSQSGMPGQGKSEPDVVSKLTPREREILRLISQGFQNKIIADRLQLSEHTVKVHVHNLIAKLRVTNRTQAAIAFLANPVRDTAPRSSASNLL